MTQPRRILITSALPYINGVKHLGNLAGSMLPADVYARVMRLLGHEVTYICATDEHGTPAELAATGEGVADALRKHPAAFPQIVATSARTGEGIPELRAAMARLLAERSKG